MSLPITGRAVPAGGLTTKVHLACEQGQKSLSVVIHRGAAR